MKILKVDDKWSVSFDPESNDSPKMWLRHGERHYPFDEKNAVVAMFYVLKEANEALKVRDGVIEQLTAALEWCIDALERDYLGSAVDREIPKDFHDALAAAKAVMK